METFQYTQENLRKLQLIELGMLKELDRICRAHQINYIIDAGTLLGAVRHKGFIPWDDDIDVRMLREDYEKFCRVCETDLDAQYFLQNHKTDDGYRWGYARILKRDTVFIRQNQEKMTAKNGIFIDIFPNDNLPNSFWGKWYCTFLSMICRKGLYSEIGVKTGKTWVHKMGFVVLNLFPKRIFHWLRDSLVKKYKDSKTESVRCFGWGSREETIGFKKEWLENTCDMEFEGLVVKAPVQTHEFLVHSFGEDYMTPPPEKDRIPRHTANYIQF